MHSGGKGIASSSLPYKRSPPSWLKVSSNQVEEHVNKLAKRGLTPSQVIFIIFPNLYIPFRLVSFLEILTVSHKLRV